MAKTLSEDLRGRVIASVEAGRHGGPRPNGSASESQPRSAGTGYSGAPAPCIAPRPSGE